MGAAMTVIDFLCAVGAPVWIAGEVAGISGGRRIAARETGSKLAELAGEAADTDEEELAVPGVREPDPQVDLVAGHGHMAVDLTVSRLSTLGLDDRGSGDRGVLRRPVLDRANRTLYRAGRSRVG